LPHPHLLSARNFHQRLTGLQPWSSRIVVMLDWDQSFRALEVRANRCARSGNEAGEVLLEKAVRQCVHKRRGILEMLGLGPRQVKEAESLGTGAQTAPPTSS